MNTMEKNNRQVESEILGSCIVYKNNLIKALEKGTEPKDFYTTNNENLFNALIECYSEKESTDVLTFHKYLEKHNVTKTYVEDLLAEIISFSDITPYLNELLSLRVNREIIKLSQDIQVGKLKTGEDIKDRLNSIDFIKSKIGNDNSIITLDKVKIVDVYSLEKIPTGFEPIDKRLLGFAAGSLNIITGYNANGKSTLINQMCIAESISNGYKVFAYSPELTNSNLKGWLYPTIANSDHFINKTYKGEQYKVLGKVGEKYIDEWIKDKLFIYSDDSITSNEKQLLMDMNRLANEGVRVFIIDNLMKIDLDDSYKNEYMAQKIFVNKLKGFARKYNAIVHLVAHPRKPQNDSPKISKYDIAGTGDITNLADYVISISRITDEDREKRIEYIDKDAVIKVMKDRVKGNGEFNISLNFDSTRKRFYTNQNELNRDYGYVSKHKLIQVEVGNY